LRQPAAFRFSAFPAIYFQGATAYINGSAHTERMQAVATTTDFFIDKPDGRCDEQREGESDQGLPQPPIAE
jgi:hypothetical protein